MADFLFSTLMKLLKCFIFYSTWPIFVGHNDVAIKTVDVLSDMADYIFCTVMQPLQKAGPNWGSTTQLPKCANDIIRHG